MTVEVTGTVRPGPLTVVTTAVYGIVAVTLCFGVASAPYVLAVLLAPVPLLLALTGGSVAVAWTAAFATTAELVASREVEPVRRYLHHWRQSAGQAALFSVPFVLLLSASGVGLADPAAGPAVRIALTVFSVALVVWGVTVLVLVATFSFRLRDVLRLGVYGLARSPRWLAAALALVVVAAALLAVAGELVTGALVVPLTAAAVLNSRTLVGTVRREFTA